MLEVTGYLKLE